VEDDEGIRDLILYALKTEDMDAVGFENGSDFFKALSLEKPALIILDIMLPDEDGVSILKRLRQASCTAKTPVIMLTAKSSEYDRVRGLDLGADDYIVKPFSLLELIARIKAVLRRGAPAEETPVIRFENISLDADRHLVTADGESVELTYKEFELLQYMMRNGGLVLSREKIMNQIWGFDYEGESRTVDMHIKTLRQKLGDAGHWVKTVRGIGYKLSR